MEYLDFVNLNYIPHSSDLLSTFYIEPLGISLKEAEPVLHSILSEINYMNEYYLKNKEIKEKKIDKKLLKQLKSLGYL